MALDLFPIVAPQLAFTLQPVRGIGWSVHNRMNWSTLSQKSVSGVSIDIPLYPRNPLWSFEFVYNYLKNSDLVWGQNPYYTAPPPFSDLQVMQGFYFKQLGAGGRFRYKPWDAAVVGQPLAAVDANNNTELVHAIGGIPAAFAASGSDIPVVEAVQELNGVNPVIRVGGSVTGFTLLPPGSTPPYEGYVIHFASTPGAAITADFTYYYRCKFSDDLMDYEYFMFQLAKIGSVKLEQVRVVP